MDRSLFLLWFSFTYTDVSLDKRRMGRTIHYSALPPTAIQEHWQSSRATTVQSLICTADQINGSCMKCNTGLKWVNHRSIQPQFVVHKTKGRISKRVTRKQNTLNFPKNEHFLPLISIDLDILIWWLKADKFKRQFKQHLQTKLIHIQN